MINLIVNLTSFIVITHNTGLSKYYSFFWILGPGSSRLLSAYPTLFSRTLPRVKKKKKEGLIFSALKPVR